MAEQTRLELATPCVTGRYSNQLNYCSVIIFAVLPLHFPKEVVGVERFELPTFAL